MPSTYQRATARIDMRLSPEEQELLKLLWRETFATHGQSFTRWLIEPRLNQVKEIMQ